MAAMPAPHVHACEECNPELRRSTERTSEQHFGVRFGHRSDSRRKYRATLDDAEVTSTTIEAMAGPDGWVLRYCVDEQGKKHLCLNEHSCTEHHGRACIERVAGHVRVEELVSA